MEKMLPCDWPAGKSVGIFLIDDSRGRAQLTVGGAIPGQAAQDGTRKQAEQTTVGKTVSSTPPRSLLLFVLNSCPDFSPQAALGHGVYHSSRHITKTRIDPDLQRTGEERVGAVSPSTSYKLEPVQEVPSVT